MAFRSGFVCILGRPNAGKSTLLNTLVGEKLAIVSPKPQTTRNRILGILQIPKQGSHKTGGQIIFVDTPGVHQPDSSLGKKMMAEVEEGLEGCDLLLVLVDASRKADSTDEEMILDLVKRANTPAFLLLNKIDLLGGEKPKLLQLIERFAKTGLFAQVIPISARKGDGVDLVLEEILAVMPEGPKYFPEDELTDQPTRFMVAEIIREQVLLAASEEVPHATTVMVEEFEEGARLTRISAVIICEREGQKAILIGKGGQMLKTIGTAARKRIEALVGTKVFLELFVKVRAGWRESAEFVEGIDWRRQLEMLASGKSLLAQPKAAIARKGRAR